MAKSIAKCSLTLHAKLRLQTALGPLALVLVLSVPFGPVAKIMSFGQIGPLVSFPPVYAFACL